jgi:hypothetical protein
MKLSWSRCSSTNETSAESGWPSVERNRAADDS